MTQVALAPLAPKTVVVFGGPAQADAWLRALRGVDGVTAERRTSGDDDVLDHLSRADVHGVALVSPVPDLLGVIKSALVAGKDVLVAIPAALGSRHLLVLEELARHRGRVILFDGASLGDERLTFVRKMTCGPQALWRPHYFRSLRTGAHASATIDDLMVGDVVTVLSIAGESPSAVSAVAPRAVDETGALGAAMVTLSFEDGAVAQLDVSILEPVLRHEVTIACEGRSILLDALNARAPLQIQASGRHRGPGHGDDWAEMISQYPVSHAPHRLATVASLFACAIRTGDAAATNAGALARAALVWETARASIARDGEQLSPRSRPPVDGQRPVLQLIHGGGRACEAPPPHLTLVSSRR